MIPKTKDALSNLLPASTKLILSDPAKFVESIIDMIENDLGITSQLDNFGTIILRIRLLYSSCKIRMVPLQKIWLFY
ncbi:hypothetical protein RG963_11735, partial [Methanosarcina sp. Z-7115]